MGSLNKYVNKQINDLKESYENLKNNYLKDKLESGKINEYHVDLINLRLKLEDKVKAEMFLDYLKYGKVRDLKDILKDKGISLDEFFKLKGNK